MRMHPTVSVIIPTFNHADYVGQAVESVLAQTYQDFEVLVIDDGSTDNTREALGPHMDHMRYIYQANSGESRARNHGIQEGRGRYIAFLDADDLWAPERLARQVPVLEAQPEVGLVYSDSYRIAADGNILGRALVENDRKELSGDIFAHLLCWQVINTDTVLVRKTCFEHAGIFDERLSSDSLQCEDWDMWLRIASLYKVAFVDEPLAYVRYHGDNQSYNLERKARSQLFILERVLGDNELPDHVRNVVPLAFSNVFYKLAREYYVQGRTRETRLAVLKALRYTPFRGTAIKMFFKTLLGPNLATRLNTWRNRAVSPKSSII